MGTLEQILGDELNVSVLRFLSAINGSFSGNAIAKKLGLNQSSVRKSLERLVQTGIVTRAEVGRSTQYELDRDKAIVKSTIVPLFETEAEIQYSLIKNISRYFNTPDSDNSAILAVILYGSVARGQKSWRDVDLLIIIDNRAKKGNIHDSLTELGQYIHTEFGVPLSPVVLSKSDLIDPGKRHFLQSVVEDGVCLYGEPPKPLQNVKRWTGIES